MTRPDAIFLDPDNAFPNNRLPVLLYRGTVCHGSDDLATTFETTFRANGWSGTWRDGIFDVHHFHATAHEVLGCARGRVRVQLGGPHGDVIDLRAGDVAVLPAGTAHKNLGHSSDYLLVGAYPPGQSPDMCYGKRDEQSDMEASIASVPIPRSDPLTGSSGGLLDAWARVESA